MEGLGSLNFRYNSSGELFVGHAGAEDPVLQNHGGVDDTTDRAFCTDHCSMIGQTVLAYTSETLSTVVRIPEKECVRFTGDDAKELIATLPTLCKAVNAIPHDRLDHKSHIVLITPSTTIYEAYSKLSAAICFRLSIITTAEQERVLVTEGQVPGNSIILTSNMKAVRGLLSAEGTKRPLTVIAHDFSPLAQEIWRSMPSMGHLVVNESSISNAPDTVPFTRGASFGSTSLATLYKHDASALANLLKRTVELVKAYSDLLVKDAQVVDISSMMMPGEPAHAMTYGYNKSSVQVSDYPSLERLTTANSSLSCGLPAKSSSYLLTQITYWSAVLEVSAEA